jgi:hypothetical protein
LAFGLYPCRRAYPVARELVSRLMGEIRVKQAMLDKLTHEMAVLKRLKFAAKSEAFSTQQHSLLEDVTSGCKVIHSSD